MGDDTDDPAAAEGKKGNDTIKGGAGNDTLFGGLGDDALYADGDSTATGATGFDRLVGGYGNDRLVGHSFNFSGEYNTDSSKGVVFVKYAKASSALAALEDVAAKGMVSEWWDTAAAVAAAAAAAPTIVQQRTGCPRRRGG